MEMLSIGTTGSASLKQGADLRRLSEKREDLLKQLSEVEDQITERLGSNSLPSASREEIREASAKIFEQNAELFQKLAQ